MKCKVRSIWAILGLSCFLRISWRMRCAVQESPEADKMDRNDPNYDSGEERRALAFHSRKVEQIKAYKQAVGALRFDTYIQCTPNCNVVYSCVSVLHNNFYLPDALKIVVLNCSAAQAHRHQTMSCSAHFTHDTHPIRQLFF